MKLVNSEGKYLGVYKRSQALAIAREEMLDLVELREEGTISLCKIFDYGKYRYQLSKKVQIKKVQKHVVKEIKFKPKIDKHDLDIKVKRTREFLKNGCKVKISVMFSGREIFYKSTVIELLEKIVQSLEDVGKLEHRMKNEGRNLIITLAPN